MLVLFVDARPDDPRPALEPDLREAGRPARCTGWSADLKVGPTATNYALSGLILIMLAAYGVALAALRTLSMRMIVGRRSSPRT